MRAIPLIRSSAHFNKPPRDVLPPPPHPEEVMKGDWLISDAGAMPQAWQTDCNNTLFHAGSDLISDVCQRARMSANVPQQGTELPGL